MIFSHWGFDAAYQKHGEKGKIKKQYFYNQSDPFQSTFSRQILLPMSPSAGCRDVCKMQLWDAYCLVLLFKQVEAESTVQLSSICWTERGWKTKQNQETINARSGKNLFLRFFNAMICFLIPLWAYHNFPLVLSLFFFFNCKFTVGTLLKCLAALLMLCDMGMAESAKQKS